MMEFPRPIELARDGEAPRFLENIRISPRKPVSIHSGELSPRPKSPNGWRLLHSPKGANGALVSPRWPASTVEIRALAMESVDHQRPGTAGPSPPRPLSAASDVRMSPRSERSPSSSSLAPPVTPRAMPTSSPLAMAGLESSGPSAAGSPLGTRPQGMAAPAEAPAASPTGAAPMHTSSATAAAEDESEEEELLDDEEEDDELSPMPYKQGSLGSRRSRRKVGGKGGKGGGGGGGGGPSAHSQRLGEHGEATRRDAGR